jgi:hypothetical protein
VEASAQMSLCDGCKGRVNECEATAIFIESPPSMLAYCKECIYKYQAKSDEEKKGSRIWKWPPGLKRLPQRGLIVQN